MEDHTQTEFRPHGIVADESAVGRVRELAARYDLPHKRVYGLAIEYAVDDPDDGFEQFVAANGAIGTGVTL